MTNQSNLDILDNLFSIFRQKWDFNKNPTSCTIRTSIRSDFIFSLCASKGANCERTQETDDSMIIDLPLPCISREINKYNSYTSDTESNIS